MFKQGANQQKNDGIAVSSWLGNTNPVCPHITLRQSHCTHGGMTDVPVQQSCAADQHLFLLRTSKTFSELLLRNSGVCFLCLFVSSVLWIKGIVGYFGKLVPVLVDLKMN